MFLRFGFFADGTFESGAKRSVSHDLERRGVALDLRVESRHDVDGPATVGAGDPPPPPDTSYVCVVDRWGNAFSATPSDVSYQSPVIPGTGLVPSSRGSASWGDPRHPSGIAPGKRPRLTPNPAMWVAPDGRAMPFGTPGGDVQIQAMTQFLLNLLVYRMPPQVAVEFGRKVLYSTERPSFSELEEEVKQRKGK
jgi:gamma-glutamyltranspeptidase